MPFYLTGDVGGTNSRLQLFELFADGTHAQRATQIFPSRQYTHLSVICKEFLTTHKVTPLVACLAVAGPVKNNSCVITNLVRVGASASLPAPVALMWFD